jgi:hypothetical protein
VAADLDDLVDELEVVVGPHLGDQAELLGGLRAQQRLEHARAGVRVQVRRTAVAGLAQLLDVHGHVAQGIVVVALDHGQIDVQRANADPRRHAIRVGLDGERRRRRFLRCGRGAAEAVAG